LDFLKRCRALWLQIPLFTFLVGQEELLSLMTASPGSKQTQIVAR
jgi:hypothetical protein